jgi:hypothetical protein
MNRSYAIGLGAGIGTLLYEMGGGVTSHELGRASFIGVFVGTLHWLVMRVIKARRANACKGSPGPSESAAR